MRACDKVSLGLVLALALTFAGCGGGGGETTTAGTTTVAAPDPGGDVIVAFARAARAGDSKRMWELLSPQTQERYGPSFEAFRDGVARELEEGVGSFRGFRVVVSRRMTDGFGVVAIDGRRAEGGREPYAVALRLVGEEWRLELGGPLKIEPLGPRPGAHERIVAQIGAELTGLSGDVTAVMWVDRQTLDPQIRGAASSATLFTNLDPPLEPGRHVAVVFAAQQHEASATAWAFTVVKQ